jgi:hypothetical protein
MPSKRGQLATSGMIVDSLIFNDLDFNINEGGEAKFVLAA